MDIFKLFNEAGATLGRIIQQAEEVFLDVPRTEYSEEYKNNIKKVDFLMVLTQKAISDAEAFLEPSSVYNLEGKTLDNVLEASERKTPLEDFGRSLQISFPTTKIYSIQLDQDTFRVGKYQKRLGQALKSFHIKAIENYVMKLKKMLEIDLKKFKDEETALEFYRLDHDYMKNRVDKAFSSAGREAMEKEYQKLKPAFDQLYAETRARFRTIDNYFTKHRLLLKDFVTIQRDYYRECDKNLTKLLRKLCSDSSKVTYSLAIDQYPDGFVSSSDVDEIIMKRKSAGVSKLADKNNCYEIQYNKLPTNGGLIINLQCDDKVASGNADVELEDETSKTPINLTNERNIQEPIFEASENEGIDLSACVTPRDHCDSITLDTKDISEAHPVRTIIERENESFFPDSNIVVQEEQMDIDMTNTIEASALGEIDYDNCMGTDGSLSIGLHDKDEKISFGIESNIDGSFQDKSSLDVSLSGDIGLNLDSGIGIKAEEGTLPLYVKVSENIDDVPDLSLEGEKIEPCVAVNIDANIANSNTFNTPDLTLEVNQDHKSFEPSLPSIDGEVKIDLGSTNLTAADSGELNIENLFDKVETVVAGAFDAIVGIDKPHHEIEVEGHLGGDVDLGLHEGGHLGSESGPDLTIGTKLESGLPISSVEVEGHLGGNIDLGLHSADLSTEVHDGGHLGSDTGPDLTIGTKLECELPNTSDDPVTLGSIHTNESVPLVLEPTSDILEADTLVEHPDISITASVGEADLNIGSKITTELDDNSLSKGATGFPEADVVIEPPSVCFAAKTDIDLPDDPEGEKKKEEFSIAAGIHGSGNTDSFGADLNASVKIGNIEENIQPKPEGHYKFGFRGSKYDYQEHE